MSDRPDHGGDRSDAAGAAPDGAADRTASPPAAESDWERRRRLARVFGDVLPETTADERDPESAGPRSTDEWLKAQVPPHHGE